MMDRTGSSKLRVALFQPVLPHYRVDLFNEVDTVLGGGLTLFTVPAPPSTGMSGGGDRSTVDRRQARTWRFGPLWFVPASIGAVWSGRWDVVVLSWNVRQLELLPVLLLGRLRGVPIVLWGHGLGASRKGLVLALRRWQVRLASAVMTYGEHGCEQVSDLVPTQTVRVVQNTTGRPPPGPDQRLTAVHRKVAYLGRLDPRKCVDRLVEAVAQLASAGLELTVDVVGDGAERTRLERQARRLGIDDRIRWHGHLSDWAVTREVLAGCDLVVLPSAAGLAVVDAFAAARGVVIIDDISSNGPEAELVVHDETGFRYSPPTVAALGECLARIYRRPHLLEQTSRRAASLYRERLTLSGTAAEFSRALEKAALSSGRSGAIGRE